MFSNTESFLACERGDLAYLKTISNRQELEPLRGSSFNRFSPIARAVNNGHDDVVKWLATNRELGIDATDHDSYVLTVAIERQNLSLVKWFLTAYIEELEASHDARASRTQQAFHNPRRLGDALCTAIRWASVDIANWLAFDSGLKIHWPTVTNSTFVEELVVAEATDGLNWLYGTFRKSEFGHELEAPPAYLLLTAAKHSVVALETLVMSSLSPLDITANENRLVCAAARSKNLQVLEWLIVEYPRLVSTHLSTEAVSNTNFIDCQKLLSCPQFANWTEPIQNFIRRTAELQALFGFDISIFPELQVCPLPATKRHQV